MRNTDSSRRGSIVSGFIILTLIGSAGCGRQQEPASGATPPLATGTRPYTEDSPWNLKIGPNPVYDEQSRAFTFNMRGVFGVDPMQFTLPVYEVTSNTPLQTVQISGLFTTVTGNEKADVQKKGSVQVPIPAHAAAARGTDANMIVWNVATGDEWGFWKARPAVGGWQAVNGYHYNTKWSGVPPDRFVNRGAGIPYLTGLIRPWEIAQGRIEHAIALGINEPSPTFIYPATQSGGNGLFPNGLRFQLDPSLTDHDFKNWGLSPAGVIIARALQDYGMIVVDGSGHPKLYAEYEGTAGWNGAIHKNTVRKIPYSAFKVLSHLTPRRPPAPANVQATVTPQGIVVSWPPSETATRYRVKRRGAEEDAFAPIATWVTATSYTDRTVASGRSYTYGILAVNHNGVSDLSKSLAVSGP